MPSLLRVRGNGTRVTNTELFFDLVYVVAVTQLSGLLRAHPNAQGLLGAVILLGMIWNAWVYTTWVTNWLDPEKAPTRVMLLGVMAASLVLSAGVVDAFGDRGLWVGGAYAAIQIGRSVYTIWASRSDPSLHRNYLRILCWCSVSGALAIAGGIVESPGGRLALFAAAVIVDIVGGIAQFWTPGMGRTDTREWTIDGSHFAERCQAFVLIALGESVVGIGAPLIDAAHVTTAGIVGVIGAFVTVAVMFLLYFDRWSERGVEFITASTDPGKVAARAYHLGHPVIIGGIILVAAGNEEILAPLLEHTAHETAPVAAVWFAACGAALFVLGHALYVFSITRRFPVAHSIAIGALALTGLAGQLLHLAGLAVGIVTMVILLALLVADHLTGRNARRVPATRR